MANLRGQSKQPARYELIESRRRHHSGREQLTSKLNLARLTGSIDVSTRFSCKQEKLQAIFSSLNRGAIDSLLSYHPPIARDLELSSTLRYPLASNATSLSPRLVLAELRLQTNRSIAHFDLSVRLY